MTQTSLLSAADIVIYTDGGSRGNPGPAALGVVVQRAGKTIHSMYRYLGEKTNNEAEYEAFLASLEWLLANTSEIKPQVVSWKLDSMLVVQQLNKNWKIKEPRMHQLALQIWQKLSHLPVAYTIQHVPRAENAEADLLVNQALDEYVA
jgi:ribonuclease HI